MRTAGRQDGPVSGGLMPCRRRRATRGTRTMNDLDRRAFLATAAGLPWLGPALARAGQVADAVLIVRESEPQNLEFPFASLESFLVPNERFYVRNHFAQPKLDACSWRLHVAGHVKETLELSYEDLRKLAAQTRPILLECAGNGRVFLVPRARGVAWQLGAVGTAEWTGVPLAAVLEKAGVKPG